MGTKYKVTSTTLAGALAGISFFFTYSYHSIIWGIVLLASVAVPAFLGQTLKERLLLYILGIVIAFLMSFITFLFIYAEVMSGF